MFWGVMGGCYLLLGYCVWFCLFVFDFGCVHWVLRLISFALCRFSGASNLRLILFGRWGGRMVLSSLLLVACDMLLGFIDWKFIGCVWPRELLCVCAWVDRVFQCSIAPLSMETNLWVYY